MRQFALEEIILPTGPYKDEPFDLRRQPFAGLLFDAIDSGRWSKIVVTGPRQCGKTLLGSVVPVLYHLFEMAETVIYGVPSLDMVSDKWHEDLLPTIERTRYRDLLPLRGGGSRGGRVASIRFRNSATLRFMTAGGGDKTRAGFTTRVLVVTETDGWNRASGTSDEGDKLSQIEKCVKAFRDRGLIYEECTVTTKEAPTWHQYENGSASRIMVPCPHCRQWVEMEREQLVGWREAASEEEARSAAAWNCPACGVVISEPERVAANRSARLVHRGQEIDAAGCVHGPMPPTRTLGFRWSGFHNLFTDSGELAAEEYHGLHAADTENAERVLRQFIWCQPYEESLSENPPLDYKKLQKRVERLPHRVVPADTQYLTLGVDCGKWHCWYILLAFRADGRIHIPDYGVFEVHTNDMAEEVALLAALREFRDTVLAGWPMEASGTVRMADAVWIDAGHLPSVVHQFVNDAECGTYPTGRWLATLGRGTTEIHRMAYRAPRRTNNEIRRLGDGWFIMRQRQHHSFAGVVHSDAWIQWFQSGLRTPIDQPGAITLFDPGPNKMVAKMHNDISRHWSNEELVEEMVAGKGVVRHWKEHGRHDWLDASKLAAAAGNYLGFTLTERGQAQQTQAPTVDSWFRKK